jgi:hypothetical protein
MSAGSSAGGGRSLTSGRVLGAVWCSSRRGGGWCTAALGVGSVRTGEGLPPKGVSLRVSHSGVKGLEKSVDVVEHFALSLCLTRCSVLRLVSSSSLVGLRISIVLIR